MHSFPSATLSTGHFNTSFLPQSAQDKVQHFFPCPWCKLCLHVQSCTSGWKIKLQLDSSEFVTASRLLSPPPFHLFLPLHEDSTAWFLHAVTFFPQLQWGDASLVMPLAAAVLVYSSTAVTLWCRLLPCNCCLCFAALWVGAGELWEIQGRNYNFFQLKIPQSGFQVWHCSAQGQPDINAQFMPQECQPFKARSLCCYSEHA